MISLVSQCLNQSFIDTLLSIGEGGCDKVNCWVGKPLRKKDTYDLPALGIYKQGCYGNDVFYFN